MNTTHPTESLLHDLVDGLLEPAQRMPLERHLRSCADCRSTVDELRSLLERARELGPLPPGRDLFPGVRARIGRQRAIARWLAATAAAAVLIGAAWLGWRGGATPAGAPEADPIGALAAAEADYEQASQAVLDNLAPQERLSPETWTVVEHNVAIIDRAIAEVRGTLRSENDEAANGHLLTMLHRKKLQLLWRASRLSAERGV